MEHTYVCGGCGQEITVVTDCLSDIVLECSRCGSRDLKEEKNDGN